MNTVTGTPAGRKKPDGFVSWASPRSGPPGVHQRPFAVVEALIRQIGEKRAAELEEIRTALATAAGGRWAVLFLPFRDYTATTPNWSGTWVAVRGRREKAEVIQADNPYALRDLIAGGWWRSFDISAAA